jgi:hypothetical protein
MNGISRIAIALTFALATTAVGGQLALGAPAAHDAAGQSQTRHESAPATTPPAPDVSAAVAPSWQTNNTVWATAYAPGRIFVGGQFTRVRPPGAAPGVHQQRRTYLAEFDSHTGALIKTFAPSLIGQGAAGGVYSLTVSPSGRILYVGGLFHFVNGHYRDNLAAFRISTGALMSWAPSAYGKVNAIAVSPNGQDIYVGGAFNELGTPGSTAGLQARTYAGEVDASGNLQPWAPVLTNALTSIALWTAGASVQQVLVGGYFAKINGVFQPGGGAVDPVNGTTNIPWNANIVPDTSHCHPPAIKTIVISNGTAYLGSEGTGIGCFDGDFAVSLGSTDNLVWQNDCLGATQALVIINGYLFKGSHAHDCAYAPGGFSQIPTRDGGHLTFHLLDQSLVDGSLAHFVPSTNATLLGVRALATDGKQLFVGGDFTKVDGRGQQGFARFGAGVDPARPAAPSRPTVRSNWKGVATVTFTAVSTPDIGTLTYSIYENGRKAALGTIRATSWPWALPVVHYQAKGLKPGTRPTFSVTASDGVKTSAHSPASAPVRIAAANPKVSYLKAVLSASPAFLWQLDERSGTVAADATPHHFDGTYEAGTTLGAPGPISTSKATAAAFNGSTGIVTADTSVRSPSTFSIEAWFKTGSNTGGLIVGFGTSQTGRSSKYDRQIYMMNDGQLVFGVREGSKIETIETPRVYNDGQWHLVVATFDSAARSRNMVLYVDGAEVGAETVGALQSYTGFWRVGGGNLAGWSLDPAPNSQKGITEPNSFFIRGVIADVAVYSKPLSPGQVAEHYALAGP